jgi:hypothetical protein
VSSSTSEPLSAKVMVLDSAAPPLWISSVPPESVAPDTAPPAKTVALPPFRIRALAVPP